MGLFIRLILQRRPVLFEQSQIRFLLKYVRHIGTPAFRAAAIDWLPFPRLRRLKEVVIKMDVEARRIYYEKKRHLQSKDTSMQVEVDAEDNDIISSLSESLHDVYLH